ncbi:DNA-binding MarR family transcriptional regulator [Sporomusaceae bacterium BoRhaA]|uniref:MarR family winged helix-turn-helix transcriptional regulator n=1 Tax=Pelorhabdus rhamnosifermentans TaxID=2772457 RepID=UPI001C06130A|nr:MarR family winged helix-turn-helix transcriptional regulator [Pelorhabdus rhamnosifermentans]MBU2700144.1 DNA-binding MarR family transcriptional regulator [Pelorhabdus rhamnosifermentans]
MLDLPDMQRCVCGNLRKTTRVITQFYDQHLQSTGLRSTQCALLRNVSLHKNIAVGELAAMLLMDQSTVTRNLEILNKHGYIKIIPENHDARKKSISITQNGEKKLEEAIPLWEEAQRKIEQVLGEQFNGFFETLQSINKLGK